MGDLLQLPSGAERDQRQRAARHPETASSAPAERPDGVAPVRSGPGPAVWAPEAVPAGSVTPVRAGGEEPNRQARRAARAAQRVRSGRPPRGGAGSAPVRAARPAGAGSRTNRDPAQELSELLAGRERTDAGWFHRGTVGYPRAEKPPHAWYFWPRALRASVRLGSLAAAGGWGWALYQDPVATLWATQLAGTVAGPVVSGWAGWKTGHAAALARHRRRWVRPAHEVLAPMLGYPRRTPPGRYLHIPLNFQESGGDPVVVLVPHDFAGDPERQAQITAALRTVLSLAETRETWRLVGRLHQLEVRTVRKYLPTKITLTPEILRLIDQTPPGCKLLSVDADGQPHYWNHGSEFPHFGLCAESGGGKSVLMELVAAQAIRDDEILVGIDTKQHSLEFLLPLEAELENLHYWRTPEQITAGMAWLITELTRRNRLVTEALQARRKPPQFQGITVLFDEVNIAMRAVRDWWRMVRSSADPPTPPAVSHTLTFLQAGRAVKMHGFVATQYGTAKGLGDTTGEVREGLGGRGLMKSGRKAWKLWAPEVENPPAKSETSGRLYIVKGARVSGTQVPYGTSDELETLALTPRPEAVLPVTDHANTQPTPPATPFPVTPATEADTDTQDPAAPDDEVEDAVVLVTLRQASSDKGEGLVNRTHQALKQARWRAQHGKRSFPEPLATDTDGSNQFDLDDLKRFDQSTTRMEKGDGP